MTRISRRSAQRIRRGIKAAQLTIHANEIGLPVHLPPIEDPLEHRAYIHTLRSELNRVARRALRSAEALSKKKIKKTKKEKG